MSFRPYREHEDLKALCPMLQQYWEKVYKEDLWQPIEVVTAEGAVKLLAAEAKVYQLLAERVRIQLAFSGDAIVGFMLYHLAYDCILHIKGLYVETANQSMGLGKGFIESLEKPIKKLFFQTYVSNPPERMISITPKKQEIRRDGDLVTWEMEWETKDGTTHSQH